MTLQVMNAVPLLKLVRDSMYAWLSRGIKYGLGGTEALKHTCSSMSAT